MKKNLLLNVMLMLPTFFIFESVSTAQPKSLIGENSNFTLKSSGSAIQITLPDDTYTSNTTLMDISGIYDGEQLNSLSQDGFTVTFSTNLMKDHVGNGWNVPPYVETATPHALIGIGLETLTINFSELVYVFGFEAITNSYDVENLQLDLYNGSTLCTSISLEVYDHSLLFAAEAGALPFSHAVITASPISNGFAIANLRFSRNKYINPDQPGPTVLQEPADATICIGDSHTFEVITEENNLTYQWYKGNFPIPGANKNTLTISDATLSDYELYYVEIKNGNSITISRKARLWIAKPLPEQMYLTEYPDPAIIGKTYPVAVTGYPDITKYTWSYSMTGARFNPSYNDRNKAQVTFYDSAAGNGKIIVEMEHVCGNRTVTQDISVKYPTGMDEMLNNRTRVAPNPVKDQLTIDNGQLTITDIRVSDTNGRIIYKAKPGVSGHQIQTSDWPSGIYLVKVTSSNNTSKVYKIVKN
ncbi:MAG: T9SS type A sorting domain-containing protein [Dysgonamonadaceae bacterium]|nr:T9SS type A sorting domain-containing protein [Dysgonamonadaceae bacterium]